MTGPLVSQDPWVSERVKRTPPLDTRTLGVT